MASALKLAQANCAPRGVLCLALAAYWLVQRAAKCTVQKEWIMQRLDWPSDDMFEVYFDSRIHGTAGFQWVFSHLRAALLP